MRLAGGAAMAWPLTARGQSTAPRRRIGVLMTNAEGDPEGQARIAALQKGLAEFGWIDGRNVRIEYRWGAGQPERMRVYAKEFAQAAPDIIVANSTPGLEAVRDATRTIPIVFVVVANPVGSGFVASLPRPGGNITGFSTFEPEIGGKWLTTLKEIAPQVDRVGVIMDPAATGFLDIWHALEAAAPTIKMQAARAVFRTAADIAPAVEAFARQANGGLIVMPHVVTTANRGLIVGLAARHGLPAVYPFRFFATDGGLVSYGIDTADLFRRAAGYIDRILRGEKPGDLPVQSPVKFELVINLNTANALGLTVPPTLLARADELIE